MKLIPLTNSELSAMVDDEDYPMLSRRRWIIDDGGYAQTTISIGKRRKVMFRMHRFILNVNYQEEVDHKNHNRLDYQKTNLRITTRLGNGRNTSKWRRPTSSKYKGVYFHKPTNKYQAYVGGMSLGRGVTPRIRLGTFSNEDDAARAYNAAALKLYGEFACLNPI